MTDTTQITEATKEPVLTTFFGEVVTWQPKGEVKLPEGIDPNTIDGKITLIKQFCDAITITDAQSLKIAKAALAKLVSFRTGIDKKRLALKREVDAEAARITKLLAPIEADTRKKVEEEEAKAAKLELERRDHLHKQMITAGYVMEGSVYHVGRKIVAPQTLWDATEEQLNLIILDGLDEVARIEREAAEQRAKDEEIAALKAKIAEGKQAAGVVDEPFNEGTPFASMAPAEKERGITIQNVADNIEHVLNTDLATPQVDMFANIPAPTAQPTEQPKQEPCTTTIMDFDHGWNACREAVLKMMRSDVKLTRQQWIENVEQLTPIA